MQNLPIVDSKDKIDDANPCNTTNNDIANYASVEEKPDEPVIGKTHEELAIEDKSEESVVSEKLEELMVAEQPTVEEKPQKPAVGEKHEEPAVEEEKPEKVWVMHYHKVYPFC